MEAILGILTLVVAVLAVMQGWQMIKTKRQKNNPSPIITSTNIEDRLDTIVAQLGKMEQRLNDIWTKINK